MGDAVTPHFNRADFSCHCTACANTGPIVSADILGRVESIRNHVGEPLTLSCGVRCEAHNAAIGGAPDSRHLPIHADAVDIKCGDSQFRYKIVDAAIFVGATCIEICPEHVHVDWRPGEKILIIGAG
jgi:zinc D-Ala-D-Ala carboxypeptidase